MTHKLTDLDHDGVLPKEKPLKEWEMGYKEDTDYENGRRKIHNAVVSEVKNLSMEFDEDKLHELTFHFLKIEWTLANDQDDTDEKIMRRIKNHVQSISQNPKILKLTKGKK